MRFIAEFPMMCECQQRTKCGGISYLRFLAISAFLKWVTVSSFFCDSRHSDAIGHFVHLFLPRYGELSTVFLTGAGIINAL